MADYGDLPVFPEIVLPFWRDRFLDVIPPLRNYLTAEWENLLVDQISAEMDQRTPPVPWRDSTHAAKAVAYFDMDDDTTKTLYYSLTTNYQIYHRLAYALHKGVTKNEWRCRLDLARNALVSYRAMTRLFQELDAYSRRH